MSFDTELTKLSSLIYLHWWHEVHFVTQLTVSMSPTENSWMIQSSFVIQRLQRVLYDVKQLRVRLSLEIKGTSWNWKPDIPTWNVIFPSNPNNVELFDDNKQ